MARKIFLIAGEPSGDSIGASLMKALKKKSPQGLEFAGIGGPLMKEQGLESLLPMEELCVMGLWEVVGHLPRLMKLIQGVVEDIEKQNPVAIVTIDLPDFNFQVAKRLKKRGISNAKIIHYVAPTVWAWRPGRAQKIAKFLDGLLCLFPFEPAYFTPHGLRTAFTGHPIVEQGLEKANGAAFRQQYGIAPQNKVLGLFLGSRPSEIHKMAEILGETVTILREQDPSLSIVIPTLPHLEYNVRKLVESWGFPAIIVSNPDLKWQAFASCDVALAVSGTVGLELAYMGIPHAIAYKMHPLSWLVIKRLIKIKYAHLVNILLDRPAVPEFLQRRCDSMEIAKGLLKLLKKEEARLEQKAEFAKLSALLGGGETQTPSDKAADLIFSFL